MAQITFKGNAVHTSGELPAVGERAPDFELVRQDLSTATLATYAGKKKVLNIFPSIDTGVCAKSVRTFHEHLSSKEGVVVLNVSADLPFAAKRFCGAEGIENAQTLSTFRSRFADDYGVRMTDGPLAGLCARAVLVLDADDRVVHRELVPEITQEPNYDAAIAALG
ncbi:MAG TPA: thiol peroxidase [Sandaracinaceae bacterium]